MCFVTETMPIGYIDSKCHISKLKSSRICLIGYSGFISHEWGFYSFGGADTQTHTHTYTNTHTDIHTKMISRNQACGGRAPGLKMLLMEGGSYRVHVEK